MQYPKTENRQNWGCPPTLAEKNIKHNNDCENGDQSHIGAKFLISTRNAVQHSLSIFPMMLSE